MTDKELEEAAKEHGRDAFPIPWNDANQMMVMRKNAEDSFKKGVSFERGRIAAYLKRWSDILNDIKYDLEASVYTLTDDQFEAVFYVRDEMDSLLKERRLNETKETKA